jgi:predicted O-linked N-acetylglucosamine transferase (SPINDLY family)
LVRLDRQQDALQAYARAIAQRPDFAAARWVYTMAQLPAVYEAEADPERCRTAFSAELGKLSQWLGSHSDLDPDAMALQPFYLAYQEQDNRDLLARYGELSAEVMRRWLERQRLPPVQPPKRGRLRVGIVSAYIFEHSVWTALIKGWVQLLDRGRFEVDVFHLGQMQDRETLFAKSHAAHFVQGPKGLREWVQIILDRQPDVLIYPELGMEALTGKLASSRLAPVQVASWGHPETSGLPTIDYYLSAEAFEPPGAQQYYTERLVTLPGTGCSYEEAPVTAVEPDLARLGIDPESPILICAGTPYKYAPQHDRVFPAIARKLGRCQFVFFMHQPAHLSEKLHRRLKATFERDGLVFERYVIVIPRQPRAEFYGLMRRAHLFLDTIGFSGFNTAMQAVDNGLPIVTREGRFMRGRLASGLLKRMGLAELVAQSEEEYVATAARLVRDADYGRQIRARIAGARASLREGIAPIRNLEEFLIKVGN